MRNDWISVVEGKGTVWAKKDEEWMKRCGCGAKERPELRRMRNDWRSLDEGKGKILAQEDEEWMHICGCGVKEQSELWRISNEWRFVDDKQKKEWGMNWCGGMFPESGRQQWVDVVGAAPRNLQHPPSPPPRLAMQNLRWGVGGWRGLMSSSVVLAGSDRFLSRIQCTIYIKNSYVAFTHKVIHCREVAVQGAVVLPGIYHIHREEKK